MVGQEVNSGRRERRATQQPLCSQRCAAPRAVTLNGLHRVIRAGRIKAAGSAKKRPKQELIGAKEKQQQAGAQAVMFGGEGVAPSALVSSSTSSRSIAGNGAVATELRG